MPYIFKYSIFSFAVIIFMVSFTPALANSNYDLGAVLNITRIQQGQKALKKSKELTVAAQKHADDMVNKNYFSHTGKNGSDHIGRIRRAGFDACYTAENIAKGQTTAQEVMDAWMKSKGHRVNNVSPKPTHYGVGHAKNVWVLVFARAC